jgi:hypothetical protein
MKLFIRLSLLCLGIWFGWMGVRDTYIPVHNRLFGVAVQGKVTGFLAGRYSPSVQLENTAQRNGRRIARRPVFYYPVAPGSSQYLSSQAKTSFVPSWSPYELNESVTIVFPKNNPEEPYLFSFSTILGGITSLGFGLLCVYIGLGGGL